MELTPSQTVGPFFWNALCERPGNELAQDGIRIAGRVFDGAAEPVPDAMVEIWQAGADGAYRSDFGWGRCGTDPDGAYSFETIKPGRVGDQAPHLEVLVFARGLLKPVLTRLYFADEENDGDPVLDAVPAERRDTLLAARDGDGYRFDIHLQGERETVFFAL